MLDELRKRIKEEHAQKLKEMREAYDRDQIHDPISILVSVGISVALSTASYLIATALAPKPPRQERGRLSGSIQLQRSEQGIFIDEIYGAGPEASIVTGSNPTWRNTTNVSTGAGGAITKNAGGTAWNAGASHNVDVVDGDDAFFEFVVGTGYATAGFSTTSSPTSGNTDFKFGIQWNPDGSVSIKYNGTSVLGNVTHWVTGDRFRVELRNRRFRLFKESAEIFPQGMVVPTPTYPLALGIAMQIVGAGVSESKVQINSIGDTPNAARGGVKTAPIITWSSGIRKIITPTEVPRQGGKGFGGGGTQTVDNVSYNIDLALMYGWGGGAPLRLLREYGNATVLLDQFDQSTNPTGVYDSGVGADADYDHLEPPDPTDNYLLSRQRVDGDISFDGDGVGTGSIQSGASGFAIYTGTATQDPDPIIEADVDGRYGSGSTPAYRNRAYTRHSVLDMSPWGGTVPNFNGVWENPTFNTYGLIFGAMCERVGVLAANDDHDFSAIEDIPCRGMLITGRPYAPAEIIGSPDIQLAGGFVVTEAEGQIIAWPEGDEPSIEIDDTEIGWLEGDDDLPDVLPELDSVIAPEITLPREVHVRSIDPDSEWDISSASASRQITEGEAVEVLEINITQLADERRVTAQKKLYRDYVAATVHRFTLPWSYLYLYPGYKITINRAEGFSHVMRLRTIDGGIGLLTCEAFALEPAVYDQPANGVFPPGYIPPQPIPAMIIASLLDIPQFRDEDQDQIGFYAGGTPRTAVGQTFEGWTLHSKRNNTWSGPRASSRIPAIIGTVVSVDFPLSEDTTTFDTTGQITVDLYGDTATLSSVTEDDVSAGLNKFLAGTLIFGATDCDQVADFPNRWEITGILSGLHDTDTEHYSVVAGARFVVLDNAIQFVPITLDEVRLEQEWRAVAIGQSLGDAATLTFAWTGGNLRPHKVTDILVARDGSTDWNIQFVGHPRASEIPESYVVEVWEDHTRNDLTKMKRRLPVTPATSQAALFVSVPPRITIGGTKPSTGIASTYTNKNNINALEQVSSLFIATQPYTRFDFTILNVDFSGPPNFGGTQGVALYEDDGYDPLTWDATKQPIDLHLVAGAGSTVDIQVRHYGTVVQTMNFTDAELYNDQKGIRFSILIMQGEIRVYQDFIFGKPPRVIVAMPGSGPPFPLRFLGKTHSELGILYVQIATGPHLSTIYAAREQIEDFGIEQPNIYLRIYQQARYDNVGLPVDV